MVNFCYFFKICPRIFKSGVLVLSFGGCSFHPFCVDRSLSICVFAPNWISHVCVSVRGVLFVFSLFVRCVCFLCLVQLRLIANTCVVKDNANTVREGIGIVCHYSIVSFLKFFLIFLNCSCSSLSACSAYFHFSFFLY